MILHIQSYLIPAPISRKLIYTQTNHAQSASLLLINARSVFKKFDELCVLQSSYHPLIITVTESWLKPEIDSNLLHLQFYTLFRDDRESRTGDGVCVWVHDSLRPQQLPTSKSNLFDHLFIYLESIRLLLLSVYFPPCIASSDGLFYIVLFM